jgi:hypothetical protein
MGHTVETAQAENRVVDGWDKGGGERLQRNWVTSVVIEIFCS